MEFSLIYSGKFCHESSSCQISAYANFLSITLNAKNFGQKIFRRFFMKFQTILKGILDKYNLLYNF